MTNIQSDNETLAAHTVAMGRSRSNCMNCGHNYLGGATCVGCDTKLLNVACIYAFYDKLEVSHAEAFAERNGLTGGFVGYTSGWMSGCITAQP